ncbi:MAG: cell division protein FtsQ/DivIB [Alphaproteobacteria bacterium]
MKRSISFWIFFVLSIILAIYFSVRVIMTTMGYGNASKLHNISIVADIKDKNLNELKNAAILSKTQKFYKIKLQDVNNKILSVPGVKESAVHRYPNGNLSIHVKMYHAIALWTDGENYFPLSDDGVIVKKPIPERTRGSIVFRGTIPNDITKITNAANDMIFDLDYIEWIENRRWDLHTLGGITIQLPEQNPHDAIARLVDINKTHNILNRDIKIIDMRDDSRILVR